MKNLSLSALKYLLAIAGVGVIVLLLGFAKYVQVRSASSNANGSPPPIAVTTTSAIGEFMSPLFKTVANITAQKGSVLSAELAGRVSSINVAEGQDVTEGTVILELDSGIEAADLREAQAKLTWAEKKSNRAKTLMDQIALAKQEYEIAILELGQAKARVDSLRATLDKKIIKAPFDGKVGIRKVNLGDYVQAGTPLIPLYSISKLQIDFSLPQNLIGQVKNGASFTFTVDAYPDRTFSGTIETFDIMIDPKTRTFKVRGIYDNTEGLLKPGMFSQVEVEYGEAKEVTVVPISSISFASYGDSVWVVKQGENESEVAQANVKIGERRGDFVVIESGISVGTEVVTSGLLKLYPGLKIIVKNNFAPIVSEKPDVKDS